jgi:exodeoxyribonuclease VII large subunit
MSDIGNYPRGLEEAEQFAGAPLSVSQLNALARNLVESRLPLLWVAGEISNFTRANSGHCYFSLKDERAQVRCVLFRQRFVMLDWAPGDGVQVEVRALPSLYEPRVEFQLNVEFMRRAGHGRLYEQFARLKHGLEREGLFARERKRALPTFPRRIGVITSTAASALRDVLTTLGRRMPAIPITIYPSQVQGEGAARQLVRAIQIASMRAECDVLLLVRGGGSIEDLWPFNEEAVARAIALAPIPVVTGVGHETDFTIADFVADARAPTPTAAAELASPHRADLLARLRALRARLARSAGRQLEREVQRVDFVSRRLVHPGERIDRQAGHLQDLASRLAGAWQVRLEAEASRVHLWHQRLKGAAPALGAGLRECSALGQRLQRAAWRVLERREQRVGALGAHLAHLDPAQVLDRGYAIVAQTDGRIVRASGELSVGTEVRLTLARGGADAHVTRIRD